MRKYFIILSLSLIFIGSAKAKAHVYQENLQTLIQMQQETMVVLNQINLTHVKGLKDCSCYLQAKQMGQMSSTCDPSLATQEPPFIRTIINIYGERLASAVSCQNVVDAYIFNRLKKQWGPLRQHLALMGSGQINISTTDNEFLISDASFSDLSKIGLSNQGSIVQLNISHRIQELPWGTKIPIAHIAPLRDEEIKKAEKDYFDAALPKCETYVQEYLEKHSSDKSLLIGNLTVIPEQKNPKLVCELLLKPHSNAQNELDKQIRNRFRPVIMRLTAWRSREYRSYHREEYARLIQGNPLLVSLSGPTPNWDELIAVLSAIQENANERFEKSRHDLEHGKNSLETVEFAHAIPYTRAKWKSLGLGEENFNSLLDTALKQLGARDRRKAIVDGGASIGLMLVCVAPWARALSPAMLLLKTSCMAALGIPLNAYFLYDSMQSYDQTLKDFFSTVEANQAFSGSLGKIQSSEAITLLSAIIFPVGMNFVEAKTAFEMMKHF